MADDILSQDEVDALLRGVSGTSGPTTRISPPSGPMTSVARNVSFGAGCQPWKSSTSVLPGTCGSACSTSFAATPKSRWVRCACRNYSEFIRNLVVPTNLNLVHVKPLRGTGLLIFDPDLVFLVVDNMFGSDGRYHVRVEGRDFTPTEQRIIRRMLDVVFTEYQKAWEPVYPIEFVFMRSEMNTQFANIATPTEVVVAVTFRIELGAGGGDFHVCMPYSMVEPLRDLLASTMAADRTEVDNRWVNLLSKQVQVAEVDLVATLAEAQITLGQILNLKKGDVISVEIPETINASVSGIPVAECHYGTINNQYALKVEKILAGTQEMSELAISP